MAVIGTKPGITRLSAGNGVPKEWTQTWFRDFISDHLKLADARNAVGQNGIVISGNITNYATISLQPPLILTGGSGSVLFNAGTNYFTTGATAPVLTANKPGAGTAITGWLKCQLNGAVGWIPVWGN